MIRFRNPSSSLETMLASFEQLYNELHDKDYFDNDGIAVVLANEYINKMCVTELKNMKKWSAYCVEKIFDFNYKKLNKNT